MGAHHGHLRSGGLLRRDTSRGLRHHCLLGVLSVSQQPYTVHSSAKAETEGYPDNTASNMGQSSGGGISVLSSCTGCMKIIMDLQAQLVFSITSNLCPRKLNLLAFSSFHCSFGTIRSSQEVKTQ